MEEYKQRLKRQNVLLWIGIVLLVVLDVLVGIFWDSLGFLDTRLMTERARHMQSMLLFGFLVYFVVKLVGNKRRLKNLWQYEEEARWQKDERRSPHRGEGRQAGGGPGPGGAGGGGVCCQLVQHGRVQRPVLHLGGLCPAAVWLLALCPPEILTAPPDVLQ